MLRRTKPPDTVRLRVNHYYGHHILYTYMSESLFNALKDAYFKRLDFITVPFEDYEDMITEYFETLRN